jgi:hypothetical protein
MSSMLSTQGDAQPVFYTDSQNSYVLNIQEDGKQLQLSEQQPQVVEAQMVLDSLPYIDEFPEEYESYALHLIEEEIKSMGEPTTSPSYVPPSGISLSEPPRLLNGPLSRMEYNRLVKREGQPRPTSESFGWATHKQPKRSSSTSSLIQQALPQPPAQPLWNDEHAWKKSLQTAKIEFEKQRLRQLNLELQQYYEPDQWRLYISQLSKQEETMNRIAEQQQLLVDAINLERKDKQQGSADKLTRLSHQFNELVERNHVLNIATVELEHEIKSLQK